MKGIIILTTTLMQIGQGIGESVASTFFRIAQNGTDTRVTQADDDRITQDG